MSNILLNTNKYLDHKKDLNSNSLLSHIIRKLKFKQKTRKSKYLGTRHFAKQIVNF